jgi:hypothetical protein
VRVECGFISVNLDEHEQGRILHLLVDIEHVTARLTFDTCAGVAHETLAKLRNDLLANLEVRCVQECRLISARSRVHLEGARAGDRAVQ